jgi:hypothetical protein
MVPDLLKLLLVEYRTSAFFKELAKLCGGTPVVVESPGRGSG